MRIVAISLLMAIATSASNIFAQTANQSPIDVLVDAGDVLFKNKGGKREALEKYKKALEINPDHVRANYMAGLCYLQTYQKSRSLSYFLKAHDIEPDFVPEIKVGIDLYPDLTFLIARAFQVGENYFKAQEYFNHFKSALEQNTASRSSLLKKGEATRAADRRIFECMVAEELKRLPIDSRIVNVKGINSPFPDYGPVFSSDGNELYFTSRRSGGSSVEVDDDLHFFEDIYVAKKDSMGRWGNVQLVKELSTQGHESVLSISKDGKTMILSKGEGNGDLFTSKKGPDGKWGKPEEMGRNINTDSRETGAFLVGNGDKLYFASDRSGGFGGLDLYVSERRSNGKWGSAKNLGPKINTSFDEDAPTVNEEGNMLTFSSKGHKAMGGFDIFKAKWDATNQTFKNPENVGFPINSADDDNTYVLAPDTGLAYYSSFKENGMGDLDIFHLLQGAPIPDSVKKEQEEFKVLAQENVPLMEDRVNVMAKDSSAQQAAEADRTAKLENQAKSEMAEESKQTSNSQAPASESVASNSEQPSGKGFEVKILESEPAGPHTVSNGQGYFMYDPNHDLEHTGSNKKETVVRILVLDTDSKIPLDGNLVFIDQDTKEKISPKRVRNGVYELAIANNVSKDFMVSVEKDGFHFKNIMVNVPAASSQKNIFLTRNIELKKHTLNKARILRNVYFDFDQAELTKKSFHELDMLQKMMNENDRLIIEVSGHADFLGLDAYNLDLSKKRAEKVVEYLASKGIDKGRLRAQGYGERKPAPGTDQTEEGRSLNRRTEFMILAQ
jgi:outer membrane protein OmpA-like peptidoglycan-associated protein